MILISTTGSNREPGENRDISVVTERRTGQYDDPILQNKINAVSNLKKQIMPIDAGLLAEEPPAGLKWHHNIKMTHLLYKSVIRPMLT